MATADAPVAPIAPKLPPVEARCRSCGGWLSTVPAGTPWVRSRCYNRVQGRNCALYGQGQTVKLRSTAPPTAANGDRSLVL